MANYQVRIQAIRSRGHNERPFVTIPVAIARALDLQKGETVEWKIVDRAQLLLVRQPQSSPIRTPSKPSKP
jgi:bifunctional DNA-binding transcriptional regulator/antitoxin component of YhaV-PrlF toxin-antitoxin module